MLRYKQLILRTLDPNAKHPIKQCDLARAIGLPVQTMNTYVKDDTLPRIDNAEKLAKHFGEDLSSMFSDDDDLTARLVAAVRKLPEQRKRDLLKELCPWL